MGRGRARAALAYVPQASASYFDFSIAEMVEMGRTAHRGIFAGPGNGIASIAVAAIERMGIAALADRPVRAVSGGEWQLALVSRALATEAGSIVMDEPTANLDFGNQSRVLSEVARLGGGHRRALSTRRPGSCLPLADRVLLLADGHLAVAEGPVHATLTSEALSALYGRPIEVAAVRLADGTERRVCVPSTDAYRPPVTSRIVPVA